MRALQIDAPASGAGTTRVVDTDPPMPGPGEVAIDVAYAGVNFTDVMARRGDRGYAPNGWPLRPGREVSGTVRALGSGVTDVKVGARVAASVTDGGMADVAVAPRGVVVTVPNDVHLADAAAAPLMLSTAVLLLRDAARLRPGESLFMHSASGGVGSVIPQVARVLGAAVRLGTVSRSATIARAKAAGWDTVLLQDGPVREAALEASAKGFDVILDPTGITGTAIRDLAPAIETAITAGVFTDDGAWLRFRHDVIRGAIYDDIPASVRAARHRDAASRLAAIGADSSRVADQFAIGATAGDDEAIDYLMGAAREATGAAPATAAHYLARAAALMMRTDPRRDLLLAERADCLMLAGRIAEAVSDSRELLGRAHSPNADAPARLRLGAALLVNGEPARALYELDAVATAAVSDEERAAALAEVGTARMWLGDFDGADGAASRAHTLAAKVGDRRSATAALATRSVVACMRGDIAGAMLLSDEALAVADGSPDLEGHGYPVYATRGWILMESDDLDAARRMLSRGRRICEDLGVRWPLATYQAYFAVERFLAGQWDDAAAELEAGIEFAGEAGVTFGLKPSLSALALIRLYRGDLIGAREAVDDAAEVSDRGSRLFDFRADWARALVMEADGDAAGALQILSARWPSSVDTGAAADFPIVGPDLVRLALRADRVDLAQEVTSAVATVAADNDIRSYTGAALRCAGLLEGNLGAMIDAVEAYAAAPRRVELALTCEEAADIAVRQQDIQTVRRMLDTAAEIFTDLDATRCLARVDAGYRRLGVRRGARGTRRRPRWGWDSLTPTERTVADLVAEGLSNPQIAERLFISRRTVQTHVSHIFAKVGIASRTELAAHVVRQQQTRSDDDRVPD